MPKWLWCFLLFFFFFISFKGTIHTKQKKNYPEKPHRTARVHCRAIQCKQTPHTQFSANLVKVVMYTCARSAWAEILQMHGFPVQTYGKTSKCHNFNSKVWIKILSGQISSFGPFCVPCRNYVPKCSQNPCELHYLNFFSTRRPHTKQKNCPETTT